MPWMSAAAAMLNNRCTAMELLLLLCAAALLLSNVSSLVNNDIHIQYDHTYCNTSTSTFSNDRPYNTTRDGDSITRQCQEYWGKGSITGSDFAIFQRSLSLNVNHTLRTSLNTHRINKLFQRILNKNDLIHVHVVGGSMTAGRNVQGYRGSWPAVFEEIWKKNNNFNTPQKRESFAAMKVHNHALGGTGTHWLLDNLSLLFAHDVPVDVVVLDYDINDMVLYTGSKGSIDLLANFELSIYRLLMLKARPAVIYLNVATTHYRVHDLEPICKEYVTGWQLIRLKEVVTRYYDVPIISQREAIWADFLCPAPRGYWDCPGSFCSHPLHKAHRLLATLLHNYFITNVNETSHSSTHMLHNNDNDTDKSLVHSLVERSFMINQTLGLDASKCFEFESEIDGGNVHAVMAEFTERTSGSAGGNNNNNNNNNNNSVSNSSNDAVQVYTSTNGRKAAILVAKDDCWGYYTDVVGKQPGFINHNHNCSNTSMYFRIQFGQHGTLNMNHMRTSNLSAGIAIIEFSRPLTGDEAAYNPSFIPPSGSFTFLGALDCLMEDSDNEHGHTLIWPTVFQSPALINSTVIVKISLQDANINPYKKNFNSFRGAKTRADPQKAKIYTIGGC